MLAHFMNNKILKGFVAVALVFLLADPCRYLFAASSASTASDKDYWTMTQREINSELNIINAKIREIEMEHFRLKSDVYIKRNNEYVTTVIDFMNQIKNRKALVETNQIAINEIRNDAAESGMELSPRQKAAIENFQNQIAQLNEEIGKLTQKEQEIRAERAAFEESAYPRIKSIENAEKQKTKPLIDLRSKIEDIRNQKFKPVAPPKKTTPSQIQITAPAEAPSEILSTVEVKVDPQEFLRALLKDWGGRFENSPFPERFWRMGMDKFSKITPDGAGKRHLNFYRNYDTAVTYYKMGYRLGIETSDPTIYAIKTTDLAETPEGRNYLLEIKNALLQNKNAGEFIVEIPNEKVYKAAFLERIQPKPSFVEPESSTSSQRPPRSKLPVEDHARSSPEAKKEITLNLARNEEVLEKSPELRGIDRSENLIEPEAAQERLEENFDRQKQKTLDESLRNEPREIKDTVAEKVNEVAGEHNQKAAKACIEQGKRTQNMQTNTVKEMISRGRTYYTEIYEKGQTNLSKSRMPWHNRGLGVLFLVLGFWDVVHAFYQGGWEAGKWSAAVFGGALIFFLVAYPPLAAYSMLSAEILAGGLFGLWIWHVWESLKEWVSSYIDASNAEYILGIKPWEQKISVPAVGWQTIEHDIGFMNFSGSPAYGLDRDKWYLKFRSQPELLNAITMYQYRLNLAYGNPTKVPPKFSREENLRMATRIIENEWARKYQEEFKKIEEAIQEHRAQQLQKEQNLDYRLSDSKDPDPEGNIFLMKIEPESPRATDTEIKVKAYYGVIGLPGDEVSIQTKMKLLNTDIGGGPEPIIKTKNLEYGIGEAYKVEIDKETLELSGSGNYELTFELQLRPKGISPKPAKIEFYIPMEEFDDGLPKPVAFQEQDIHRIDPLFTGAKVMKKEKEDLYSAVVFNPIAELRGIHARNTNEIYKGLIIDKFEILQFGEPKWAREKYENWREGPSKRQDAKFEEDSENLEYRLLSSSKITRWVNYQAVYSTRHGLEAAFIHRDIFFIWCRISTEEGDFNELSERWQKIRLNCKKLIDDRIRQLN